MSWAFSDESERADRTMFGIVFVEALAVKRGRTVLRHGRMRATPERETAQIGPNSAGALGCVTWVSGVVVECLPVRLSSSRFSEACQRGMK